MSGVLPILFAVLAAGALLGALVSIWQSLRAAFGAGEAAAAGGWAAMGESAERQALLAEKESLLRSIEDLAFDHQVGKLSDADFERLDRALRARAREVLRLLDEDLGPYRDRAEELIRRHLKDETGETPYRDAAEVPEGEETVTCPGCGTRNDADAKFCKECGKRLGAEEASEREEKDEPESRSEPEQSDEPESQSEEPGSQDGEEKS